MKDKKRINKSKAIEETIKGLRKGYTTEYIFEQIRTKWDLGRTTFYSYMSEAEEIHTEQQQEIQRLANEQLVDIKKEELKSDIITIQERKDFLTKLITAPTQYIDVGNRYVEVLVHEDGRMEVITNDIKLKALQELNKMDGSYSPEKFEDVTERKPLSELFEFTNEKD